VPSLRRYLRAAAPRCARAWSRETRHTYLWHTCTRRPGHEGDHACPCGAHLAQAAAGAA
jgi:hypothetical protein